MHKSQMHSEQEAMVIQSEVIKYGDNVDTDVIIPARYLNSSDPSDLAAHCMEDLDEAFGQKVKDRKIISAGKNFGCGSSREHAPIAIKAAGVRCIIAESFARIFYRNAINIGLPILECAEAAQALRDGAEVDVDLSGGIIRNLTSGEVYKTHPFPSFLRDIIESGGLTRYAKERML